MNEKEIETKFYLSNLHLMEKKLRKAGARLSKERVFEINLRFDTPDGYLTRQSQVLRLRQDSRVRMTYKGPSEAGAAAAVRREVEFELSSFEAGRNLLEALGYQVHFIYEKFRTTYLFENVEIVLDEMPYGNFCEIEGPDPQTLQKIAEQFELDWEKRCNLSYTFLFNQLKASTYSELDNLTFEAFKNLQVKPEELNLQPADL